MMIRGCSTEEEDKLTNTAAAADLSAAAYLSGAALQQKNMAAKRAKLSHGVERGDWNALCERLALFKAQHGHCNVPLKDEEDPELGEWVAKQRELHKPTASPGRDKLTREQVQKLNQLGFEWQARNPRNLMWETRFGQLQRFKKKYGHAQVPIGWPENVQLANWVSKQRQEYKNLLRGRTTRLDEKRIRLLNSVGFAWQLQRGGRRRQLKARKDQPHSDGDSTASEGVVHHSKNEGPCILPGEVLIGQGAPAPMPPESPRATFQEKTVRKGLSPNKVIRSSAAPIQIPSPLQQPLQHSFQQSLQLQQLQQPSLLSNTSSVMGTSVMGSHFLNRAATGGVIPPAAPNNDLLDYVLARNALLQNLQQQQQQPNSLQMLGVAGTYPNLGFQAPSQSQLLAAQRNSLLTSQSGLFPLTASSFPNPTTNSWRAAAPSSWLTDASTRSNLLDGHLGAGLVTTRRGSSEESKQPGGGGSSNFSLGYSDQLQHLPQLYQHRNNLQQTTGRNTSSLSSGVMMPNSSSLLGEQQLRSNLLGEQQLQQQQQKGGPRNQPGGFPPL